MHRIFAYLLSMSYCKSRDQIDKNKKKNLQSYTETSSSPELTTESTDIWQDRRKKPCDKMLERIITV